MGQKITKSARVAFKDVTREGEKTVRAVVTAPTLDRDGDIIDTASLRLPLKGGGMIYARDLTGNEALDIPFLLNHSFIVEDVIGSARSGILNSAGELEILFGVSSRDKAQDMFTLIDEGHLDNAFSQTILYDYSDIVDGIIYDAEVIEISLVFKGSNRQARLLAVSKSLIKKERIMSKDAKQTPELQAKYALLEKTTKEIEEMENQPSASKMADEGKGEPSEPVAPSEPATPADPEEPVNPEEPAPADPATPAEPETPAEPAEPAPAPAPETPTEPTNEPAPAGEGNPTMDEPATASKAIAAKAAASKAPVVEQPAANPVVQKDPNAHKVLVVKQIAAFNRKDWARVAELNAQAEQLDVASGISSKSVQMKKKEISRTDGTPLYLVEQLNRDVEACYGDYGNLGRLVNNIQLTVSPKFSTIVQEGDVDFQPVGWASEKPEDEGTFSRVSVEPKPFAVIQVWNDHVAEDAAINLYDLLVQNVAQGRARLEDRIITTFATVTTDDGVVYPDQGILEQISGGRINEYVSGDGEDFYAQLLATLGSIRGCDRSNITLAMNGVKLFELAGLRNSNGDLIFNGNGTSLNLGLVGSYNFVTSDEIPTTDIIVGNFRRYYLGSKGGLELTTSNQATVGDLNLFTTDHSALRAVLRMEGDISTPSLAGAFAVLRQSEES